MFEIRLTETEMDIFKKMNQAEQIYVKRLMWMASDTSVEETSKEYRDLLHSLFVGAYIKYIDPEAKDYE